MDILAPVRTAFSASPSPDFTLQRVLTRRAAAAMVNEQTLLEKKREREITDWDAKTTVSVAAAAEVALLFADPSCSQLVATQPATVSVVNGGVAVAADPFLNDNTTTTAGAATITTAKQQRQQQQQQGPHKRSRQPSVDLLTPQAVLMEKLREYPYVGGARSKRARNEKHVRSGDGSSPSKKSTMINESSKAVGVVMRPVTISVGSSNGMAEARHRFGLARDRVPRFTIQPMRAA